MGPKSALKGMGPKRALKGMEPKRALKISSIVTGVETRYTHIYIYMYIYNIHLTIYSCARDLAFGPTPLAPHPGTGTSFFEYGMLFIDVIPYNVRIFFCGGLRRQKKMYFTLLRV